MKKVVAISILVQGLMMATGSAWSQGDKILEEIIVTAQKRQQNLQEVPVSVTAFSGEALREAHVTDIFDLPTIAPGLRIGQNQVATTSSFYIRGVGTSSSNFGLESSVGLYVDGVYRSRQSAVINNLVDIESIEVLRGPQGSLFGKNTPSGAVLINTNRPTHEAGGFVELDIGNYDLRTMSGAYNASLVEDILAFRVSGFAGQRDGFVDDVFLGENSINDRDRFGGNLQFLYTPRDNLDVRIIADYSEIDETCCAAITLVDSLFANSLPTFVPGTDAVLRTLGGTTFTGDQFSDYQVALNQLPRSVNEDKGVSAEVNWDTGNVLLTSISAWRSFKTDEEADIDFSNIELFVRADKADQSSFSQEFRIRNNQDERLRYVVGLYYFTQNLDNDTRTTTGPMFNTYIRAVNPGLGQLINGISFASVATGGLVPPPAEPYATLNGSALNEMRQKHESGAIFGQLEFDISESFTVTAGLRYTKEEKKIVGTFTQAAQGDQPDLGNAERQLGILQLATVGSPENGIPPNPALLALFDPRVFTPFAAPDWGYYLLDPLSPRPDIDETIDDDQVTGTLKLSWYASDDIMAYASWGTGYKSGGTNTDRINMGQNPLFGPETSESLELGVKADFPAQRLRANLSIHSTGFDDFQSNAFRGAGFNLQNAGKLDTYGGELEVWWSPTNNLTLSAAYVRSVADFEEFDRGNCWISYTFHTGIDDPGRTNPQDPFCDRGGDRVSFNPENFFVLTAKQNFRLTDGLSGFGRLEWSYTGDQVMDVNNDPFKLQDSYTLLDFSVGLLFEEFDAELMLWGRNVTDERWYNVVFDVPVQDGKLNAYPGVPRTYGVNLRFNF